MRLKTISLYKFNLRAEGITDLDFFEVISIQFFYKVPSASAIVQNSF